MRDRIPALPRNNLSWLTSRGVVSYLRGSFFIKKLGRISSETLAVFARHSNRASRWRNRMQLAAVVRRERIYFTLSKWFRPTTNTTSLRGIQVSSSGKILVYSLSLKPMINTPRYKITEIKSATAVIREASSSFSIVFSSFYSFSSV